MRQRAHTLAEWKSQLSNDESRMQAYCALNRLWDELVDSHLGITSIEELERTAWAKSYLSAHPDDRLVFDSARLYARLMLVAENPEERSERREDALEFAAQLQRTDLPTLSVLLKSLRHFLSPIESLSRLAPREIADELIEAEVSATSMQEALEELERRTSRRARQEREDSAFQSYLDAIRRQDPLARSLNHWSRQLPPRWRRHYFSSSYKSITRSIQDRLSKLAPAVREDLELEQQRIHRRETSRHNRRRDA